MGGQWDPDGVDTDSALHGGGSGAGGCLVPAVPVVVIAAGVILLLNVIVPVLRFIGNTIGGAM